MITKIIKSKNIFNLKFKHKSCDLNIQISDNPEEEFKICYRENEDLAIYTSDNTLYIEQKNIKSFLISFFTNSETIELTIPKNRDIFISVLNGDIDLYGTSINHSTTPAQNIKKLEIKQTSGDLYIEKIYTPACIISNISGDIDIKDSFLKNLSINGISSDININDCGINILKASTISGDIYLSVASSYKNIKLNSKSGDIYIKQPFKNIYYELKTFSGDINTDNIIYDEKAPAINASTLSGDIDIAVAKNIEEPIDMENSFENISSTSKTSSIIENEKNSSKIDEKNKILHMLLNNKLSEKEAKNLLESLGYTEEEIHDTFEEYLFIKMENSSKNNKNNNNDNSNNNNNNNYNNNNNNNNNFSSNNNNSDNNSSNINDNNGDNYNDDNSNNSNNNNSSINASRSNNSINDSKSVSNHLNSDNSKNTIENLLNSKEINVLLKKTDKIIDKTVKKSLKEAEKILNSKKIKNIINDLENLY